MSINEPQSRIVGGSSILLNAKVENARGTLSYDWNVRGDGASFVNSKTDAPTLNLPTITGCNDKKLVVALTVTDASAAPISSAPLELTISKPWCTYTQASKQNDGNNLASDVITKVALDSNQKLWVGTRRGLNSFDGSTWKLFDSTNEWMGRFNSGSGSSFVAALYVWSDNVWLGMKGDAGVAFGAQRFNQNLTGAERWINFSNYPEIGYEDGVSGYPANHDVLRSGTINDFTIIDEDRVLIATDRGAELVNIKTYSHKTLADGQSVNAITMDGSKILLGTDAGLYVYENADTLTPTIEAGAPWGRSKDIRTIAIKGDDVYVGLATSFTYGGGIAHAKLENGRQIPTKAANWMLQKNELGTPSDIRKIVFGSGEAVWAASKGGLHWLTSDKYGLFISPVISVQGGFTTNDLKDLAYDSVNNVLWIATDQGLTRYRPNLFIQH